MCSAAAMNLDDAVKSSCTNVVTTGVEGDLPHGVRIATAASMDFVAFIRAEDGVSATGNSTNVVYVSGAGLRRTYCVYEEPDLDEGKVSSVKRGAEGERCGAGYRTSGHVDEGGEKLVVECSVGCAIHA